MNEVKINIYEGNNKITELIEVRGLPKVHKNYNLNRFRKTHEDLYVRKGYFCNSNRSVRFRFEIIVKHPNAHAVQ